MADEITPRLALPLLQAGQAQKEIAHNEALTVIDALVHARAASADLGTPPGAPMAGQCWIVPEGASGAWSGRGGALALWTDGGWRFLSPPAGARVWVDDRANAMVIDGTGAWGDAPDRPDGYYVAAHKVIGARGSAIGDPVGGSVVDIQGRAAIVAILDAMRAHGLISSS